eukprot:526736-Pelagomonas_calceolata.AAC.2
MSPGSKHTSCKEIQNPHLQACEQQESDTSLILEMRIQAAMGDTHSGLSICGSNPQEGSPTCRPASSSSRASCPNVSATKASWDSRVRAKSCNDT